MPAPFYSIDGSTLTSAFFGFSLALPPEWEVSGAKAGGTTAVVFLRPPNGNSDQLQIALFSRTDEKMRRNIDDPTVSNALFRDTVRYPFGEARLRKNSGKTLLFERNGVIVQITAKEGPSEVEAEVETILHSLRFFDPSTDYLPTELRTFRYLHTRSSKRPRAADPSMARAELVSRLAHHRRYGHSFDAGLICVLLEQMSDARELFRAASFELEARARHDDFDAHIFANALEAALFAGAEDRIVGLSSGTTPQPQVARLSPDRALYAQALPWLVQNDDEKTAEFITSSLPQSEKWLPGVSALIDTVLQRNQLGFADALGTVLDAHHRQARAKSSQIWNSARAWVCVPATALTLVAVRRGLRIPEHMRGRRATLRNLLVVSAGETPEGGKVLPGTTFDLEVEYLPALLVG